MCVDDRIQQKKKLEEELRDEKIRKCVIRLQAWWRGVMVGVLAYTTDYLLHIVHIHNLWFYLLHACTQGCVKTKILLF